MENRNFFDKKEVFNTKLHNCGITILEKSDSSMNIICHNDNSHLEKI